MSSAEYVAILASIILGLAIADLGTSFHRLVNSDALVRWHWLPVLFVVTVLLSVIQFWWSRYQIWMEIQTIGEFLVPISQLILLFLLSAVALPDMITDDEVDLKSYYFARHRYAWSLFAAYVASAIVTRIVEGAPIGLNLVGLIMMAALAIWDRPLLHYLLVPLIAVVPFGFLWAEIST